MPDGIVSYSPISTKSRYLGQLGYPRLRRGRLLSESQLDYFLFSPGGLLDLGQGPYFVL